MIGSPKPSEMASIPHPMQLPAPRLGVRRHAAAFPRRHVAARNTEHSPLRPSPRPTPSPTQPPGGMLPRQSGNTLPHAQITPGGQGRGHATSGLAMLTSRVNGEFQLGILPTEKQSTSLKLRIMSRFLARQKHSLNHADECNRNRDEVFVFV